MRKLLLAILGIALWSSVCLAEEIFVAQNAAGANNGSNCANAHSASWFNTAGNWGAGVGQISAGDTAHLCGTFTGTNGQTMLTVQASGSSGSPITILFEPNAKLTAGYWGTAGALVISGPDFIVVDGGTNGRIDATANGTNRIFQNASDGIVLGSGSSNITLKSLTIAEMYLYATGTNDPGWASEGVCISGSAGSNLEVHDITCHDAGTSWDVHFPGGTTTTSWKFHDNHIYNFADAFFTNCGGTNGVLNDFQIYNNNVHDVSFWGRPPPSHPHTDGFQIAAIASGCRIDNLKVYDNKIYGTGWVFSDGQRTSTAAIFLDGNANLGAGMGFPGALVFNNELFLDCTSNQAFGNGFITVVNANTSSQASVGIFNNTIIGCMNLPNPGNGGGSGILTTGVTASVNVENNLISGTSPAIFINGTNTSCGTCNYNHLATPTSTSAPYYYQTGFKTQAQWQALGFGLNDIFNQAAQLVCGSPNSACDGANDPRRLTASSPSRDAGISLSAFFTTDKDGVSRPQGSAWDIGCFESMTTSPPPNPPTSLRVY